MSILHGRLRHRQPQNPVTGFNILTPSRRVVLENPTVLLLGKKLSSFDGKRTFITAFTWARPRPRLCEMIRNTIRFCGEELPAPRPTAKLETHPLSAVRDCLFNTLAANLHPHPEEVPFRVDRDPQIRSPKYLLCFVCFLLGNSSASGVYMPMFRNTLSVPSS